MRMLLLAILLNQSGVPVQDVPYRVLRLQRSEVNGAPEEGVGCAISIGEGVGLQGLKRVICTAIRGEKLDRYRSISVSVYLRLSHLSDIPIDPTVSSDAKHLIGAYGWDASRKSGRLAVALDEMGERLQGGIRYFEFDHTRECLCTLAK